MLQHLGFVALASTSSGFAWTTGRPDYAVTRDDVLGHLARLSAAVDLPVNADFEAGFAADPEGVADSVGRAVATGIAGLSIEDRDLRRGALYDRPMALDRLRAARHAIDQAGGDVVLVARTEGLLTEPDALSPAIDRLVAFAEAGADCLYAPGVRDRAAIGTMVRAVAPKPLNVLALDPAMPLQELADLGVRRVSTGGALAAVGWAAFMAAATALRQGAFQPLAARMPGHAFDTLFAGFAEAPR